MRLVEDNGLKDIQYVEPYAGGASVAIAMLLEEYASVVHINDLSLPVYAFWHTVLNQTDWLCRRIERARVTMRQWRIQRTIYEAAGTADLAELGFATLFLNRTNRSGIVGGGVIGGKSQDGEWSMDVRFGRPELIRRIRAIGRYASRIKLYRMDALDFTGTVASLGRNTFTFYDPPYIENGHKLYLNDYTIAGHRRLAARVSRLKRPWVVTYDMAAIGHGLYENFRRVAYELSYTTQDRYRGREVMFVSDGLRLPKLTALMGPRMRLIRHQTQVH